MELDLECMKESEDLQHYIAKIKKRKIQLMQNQNVLTVSKCWRERRKIELEVALGLYIASLQIKC